MSGATLINKPINPCNSYVVAVNGINMYFSMGAAEDLEFTDAHITSDGITISAWVYTTASISTTCPIVTIGRSGTNKSYGISCKITSAGKPQMHLMGLNSGVEGSGSNNRRTRVTSSYVVPINTWTHITWIFDGGVGSSTTVPNWLILVNGVSQTTSNSGTNANLTLNYSSPTHESFISQDGKTTTSYQEVGFIGDVTIHSVKLTANAVKEKIDLLPYNWTCGIDWQVPGTSYTSTMTLALQSWWRMGTDSAYPIIPDEGLGTNKYDLTMVNNSAAGIVTTPLWG